MSWLTIRKMCTTMRCNDFIIKERGNTTFFLPFPFLPPQEKTVRSGTEMRNLSVGIT